MSRTLTQVPLDTFWGTIEAGTRQRATTQMIYAAVRLAAEQEGVTIAPGIFQRMNELRGLATQQRNADDRLSRLSPTDTITSQHIATDINSRDALQRSLAPRYRVGFSVTGVEIATGKPATLRLTDVFGANLPATLGDLQDALSIEGPALGEGYGFVLEAGVSDISIREV